MKLRNENETFVFIIVIVDVVVRFRSCDASAPISCRLVVVCLDQSHACSHVKCMHTYFWQRK